MLPVQPAPVTLPEQPAPVISPEYHMPGKQKAVCVALTLGIIIASVYPRIPTDLFLPSKILVWALFGGHTC